MGERINDIVTDMVADMVADLLYYDRKGDEEVPVGAIEAAVAAGEITEAGIVAQFASALHRGLTEGR